MNAVSKLNVVNADSGCVQVNVSKLNVANADSECAASKLNAANAVYKLNVLSERCSERCRERCVEFTCSEC